MKFPSIKNLTESAANTIKRFPLEVLFALAGTIASTVKIELSYLNRVSENWCMRTIMIANLGLLLSLSATLYTESKVIAGKKKLIIKLTAAVFALLLIFIINPGINGADYVRFFLFSLSFHLMVAYAAFTGGDNIQAFWQFNKTLFLRFLTAVLYGVVLFLGLAAAIGAMNFLFNFKFEWDTFAILWTWIVGMFSTIFFLSGVPRDMEELNKDFSYPKGLKVFTQYVLIPLATIYVAILLAYEIKILVQWQLPKGLVSNLILGYAVFGILALLLVYPIREREENKWLKTYARSFYFLLIPLLVLLFTAVGTRVFRYGITEMRYFLILLACWLLFITVYFLTAKKQNIKLIPISLSLLTLLSIYGPQSAFSIAMYSQRRALVDVFKRNNAFKDGKLLPVDSIKITRKDGYKATATLDYLISKHDLLSLQPYFSRDLQKVSDSLAKTKPLYGNYLADYELTQNKLEWAKKQLNLGHFMGYYRGENDTTDVSTVYKSYEFVKKDEDVYITKGADYLITLNAPVADTTDLTFDGLAVKKMIVKEGVYALQINKDLARFDIRKNLDSLLMSKVLNSFNKINKDQYNYTLPDDRLIFTQETAHYNITMNVKNAHIEKDKTTRINFVSIYFLVRKK
jgi:hypothetical protein